MNYNMVTEGRTTKLKLAYQILLWLCGCETWTEDEIEENQSKWSASLIPPGDNEREQQTFEELEKIRESILRLRET